MNILVVVASGTLNGGQKMKLNLTSSENFIVHTMPKDSDNVHMIRVMRVNCIEDDGEYIYFKRSDTVVAALKKSIILGYSKIGW